MLVQITKLAGETGLRQPGTRYILNDELGNLWIKRGWAIELKEEKVKLETKEEKFNKKAKETKRKKVPKNKD
jgi:hypothetical protein